MRLSEPTVSAWRTTELLDAGIFLAGLALATAFVCLTPSAGPPYPHLLWHLDRIGAILIYGMSIGFLGILASHYAFCGRRESLWKGEWLGITTAALLLSTTWLETNGLLGQRAFVSLLASCLIQCALSIMSAGLLAAKLITRHRPGPRVEAARTNILGLLVCAITGPFVYWQLAAGMMSI
jgi:hypothetical protein